MLEVARLSNLTVESSMLFLLGQTIFDLDYAVYFHTGASPLVHKGQHASVGLEFDCVELLSGIDAQFLGA